MLTMTYPVLKEPKILFSVAKNILAALEETMTAILEYERLFKRISPFNDTFDAKFTIFRNQVVPRYDLDKSYAKTMMDLREIVAAASKSPMEFSRKEKYVICSDSYEIRTLTEQDLKKILFKAKIFIDKAHIITTKNDGLFR